MSDQAREFEAERKHLTAVAYRMLGSRAEAEDAVQETWLRYAAALAEPTDRAEIRDLRAWLTTAVARICLDVLRSARVRRAAYPGQWLPEPVIDRLPGAAGPGGPEGFGPDPAERAARTDQVAMALLVVLERLGPEQRVAFVLHDVFAVPFTEIAAVLGTSVAAARQLASRGRRAIAEQRPRHSADPAEQRRLLAAFLAAAESGDLDRLVGVLAPDAVFVSDGGGHFPVAREPIRGAVQVARFTAGLVRRLARELTDRRAEPVLVNGEPGLRTEGGWATGRLRSVLWITAAQGRITGVYNLLNPEKLAHLPALEPGASGWPPTW
ncbi:RNA polymerase sigma factor SigJ [Solwaraspora sp. WMMD1047]|uniref:RNA polymerase sigma factor SigJ n=1 Tax=Solwaraspora sp. WMMD1047 TaxID=3016102 RepID=UPI0024164AA4|nr:RNA polymerase sigma factor SigJ [Solwaraspora sp. WMMD1047]MDG4833686.1 RNA polymerase sigma factor SigJ [Solwaraspora sp. WMMD1047]